MKEKCYVTLKWRTALCYTIMYVEVANFFQKMDALKFVNLTSAWQGDFGINPAKHARHMSRYEILASIAVRSSQHSSAFTSA